MKKRLFERMHQIIFLIYPKRCPFCGEVITLRNEICARCQSEIKPKRGKLCTVCGKDIGSCLCKQIPYYFQRCISVYDYGAWIKEGIHQLKFKGYRYGDRYFSEQMLALLRREYQGIAFDLVTAVPLIKERQRLRGYNQAKLLALPIAKALNVPYCDKLLKKVRVNKQQHLLSTKERAENVRGVYQYNPNFNIFEKTILLCDDVFTTGSTINECAKQLLEGGAAQIFCITLASSTKR